MTLLLLALAASFVLWVLYVWVMAWKAWAERNHKRRWLAYLFAYPVAVVGVPLDVLYNLVVGTIIFREFPLLFRRAAGKWRPELTLTSRLQRYIVAGPGASSLLQRYRFWTAYYVCRYLLHPWDRDHCWKREPLLP